MDYGFSEKRKTRKDLKRKRLYRVYKKGGRFRDKETGKSEEEKRD